MRVEELIFREGLLAEIQETNLRAETASVLIFTLIKDNGHYQVISEQVALCRLFLSGCKCRRKSRTGPSLPFRYVSFSASSKESLV